MATRCFCPPERVTPRSPTRVSQPWSLWVMNSSAQATRAASHGDLGRSHVHGHDHGEGALEDRLGDVQDIDIVLSQQGADGGDDAYLIPL